VNFQMLLAAVYSLQRVDRYVLKQKGQRKEGGGGRVVDNKVCSFSFLPSQEERYGILTPSFWHDGWPSTCKCL
jgi:hypothetical protein